MKVGDLVRCPYNYLTHQTGILGVITDIVGRHIFLKYTEGSTDCWFEEDLEILS